MSSTDIAAAVRAGRISAVAVVEATLSRIEAREPAVHAFTTLLHARALSRAGRIDTMVHDGLDPGPLCGVPFAAKDLFDIEGVITLAGSKLLADRPPAARSAAVVRRLEGAGAVLVGALNMEEFAYGFLTDNAHHGRTCNPHDARRTAGGSSGGTGAAVAADMLPVALGTDTNGSIRIPASFCGVVGMKPTFGRIDVAGMVPLAPSQDHVGWIGRTVDDVSAAWRVLAQEEEPDAAPRPARIGFADDYFERVLSDDARVAMARVARCFPGHLTVRIPACDAARGAAYAVTSSEASSLRLPDLRRSADALDPATRDRFLAGALLPADWYVKALRFRNWFRGEVEKVFERVDVIVLPASPFRAPLFGEERIEVDGAMHPVRATIGRFTQPISPLGFPIVCVPAAAHGQPPVGVQLMGRPGSEWSLLAVAKTLEGRLKSE